MHLHGPARVAFGNASFGVFRIARHWFLMTKSAGKSVRQIAKPVVAFDRRRAHVKNFVHAFGKFDVLQHVTAEPAITRHCGFESLVPLAKEFEVHGFDVWMIRLDEDRVDDGLGIMFAGC